MTSIMTTIFINSVERESEKAMLLNVNVSFNANTPKPRSIWFPKSVIESRLKHHLLRRMVGR